MMFAEYKKIYFNNRYYTLIKKYYDFKKPRKFFIKDDFTGKIIHEVVYKKDGKIIKKFFKDFDELMLKGKTVKR